MSPGGDRRLTLGDTHTHTHDLSSPPLPLPGARKAQGGRKQQCAGEESGCRGLAALLLPVPAGAPAACGQDWGFHRVLASGKRPRPAGACELCSSLSGVRGRVSLWACEEGGGR